MKSRYLELGISDPSLCSKIQISIVIDKCNDAEETEACAIREAIELGSEYSLKLVDVEPDWAVAATVASRVNAVASRCWGVYKEKL